MRHTMIHHFIGCASRLGKFLALGLVLSGIVALVAALPAPAVVASNQPVRETSAAGLHAITTQTVAAPAWLARAGQHHKHPLWRS